MRIRTGIASIAAVVVTLAAAPLAHAETVEVFDVIDDAPYSAGNSVDISSATVSLDDKNLVVEVTMKQDADDMWSSIRLQLDTNNDQKTDYYVTASHFNGFDAAFAYKNLRTSLDDANTTGILDGKGLFTVTQSQYLWFKTVTFTIPATTIKKPKSVRIKLWSRLVDGANRTTYSSDYLPDLVVDKKTRVGTQPWSELITMTVKVDPSIKLVKSTVKVNKTPKVKLNLSPKVAGKATVYDGGKKLTTVKVDKATAAKGAVTIPLPKTLKPGAHKITVKYAPTSKKYAAGKSAAVTLTVKKK